ncbi:cytochrome P450 [Annulohypoxylon truncatum]|uniref:cytochrome P450 n=1 Tax=Annulohypoxylon truncatum TaxID=327061 RepID=UPI002008813D|nr:cytochrome P450 [Annulohypoxylon truncatum]KAI1211052.1 cytochrome P450 [Annulohypoxylon truncatum]
MLSTWRNFSVISLLSSYLLVSLQPGWTKSQLFGTFVAIWFLQAFVYYAIWRAILYPKLFSPLRGLPHPKNGSFFMGQFKDIRSKPTGIPMREWVSTIPNNGIIRYLGPFNQERLLISGSKALAEVLVTRNYEFQKPTTIRFGLSRLLGVGILLAEGEEHKFQRKNLLPAFAFRHVKELYSTFWLKGREVVQVMTKSIIADAQSEASIQDPEKAKKTSIIEVGEWASRVTLDIIGLAGFGQDFGSIQDPKAELSETYRSVFKPSRQAQRLAFLSLIFPNWLLARLPIKRNNDINAAAETIRNVCRRLIQEKKEKLARKELKDRDILSVALESGGFSDENLVDQLMTFLAAGHETTATAMTWGIYMLCRYPEIQKRLRDEIRANLPPIDSDKGVNSQDIDHLPYLNAVASEVLRYYAPVPLTLREAAVDTTIQGQKVPKGTAIMLSPWATNFDKTMWGPDAHEFNPDRWMPKGPDDKKAASGGASSNYAFLTFLHGPRSCIGLAFARAEFACLLATWVGRFEFALANEEYRDEKNIMIKGGITARPEHGMHVYATVLDGW